MDSLNFNMYLRNGLIGTLFTETLALLVLGIFTAGATIGLPLLSTWGSNVTFDMNEVQSVALHVLIVYVAVRAALSSIAAAVTTSVALRFEDVIVAAIVFGSYWYFLEHGPTLGQATEFAKPVLGTVGSRLLRQFMSGASKELVLAKNLAIMCLQFHLVLRLAFVGYAVLRAAAVLALRPIGFCKDQPILGPGGLADALPTLSMAGWLTDSALEGASTDVPEASIEASKAKSNGGEGEQPEETPAGEDLEEVSAGPTASERTAQAEAAWKRGGARRRKGKGKEKGKGKGKGQEEEQPRVQKEDKDGDSDDDPLPEYIAKKRGD